MREIKFRAWDKRNKKMIQSAYDYENLNYFIDFYGSMGVFERPDKNDVDTIGKSGIVVNVKWFYPKTINDDLILMQYTGIKDKNGKEIYEGDIFEAPHSFGSAGWSIRKGVVKFDLENGYQWNYWVLEQLVVIGNIYENPELLNVIKK